jgi:hypothetical protein
MGFQSTVNINAGYGVIGEIFVDGPTRADTLRVNSSGTANTVGFAFTKSNSTGIATVGGAITNGSTVFAGILANPKVGASIGTTSGTLVPTLTIPDNVMAEFLTMGVVVVNSTNGGNIGDQVQYVTATGALSTVAPGASASANNTLIPGASVFRDAQTGAGLIAIRLA